LPLKNQCFQITSVAKTAAAAMRDTVTKSGGRFSCQGMLEGGVVSVAVSTVAGAVSRTVMVSTMATGSVRVTVTFCVLKE